MNGIHDLGGMDGFGPVLAEPQDTEPVFHAEWEKTVLALANVLFRLRRYSLDRFRKMIETQPPVDYLRHSYYENWYASISRLAVDSGLVSAAELARGRALVPSAGGDWTGDWAPEFVSSTTPRYAPGDRVRARNRHVAGHTREPRYVRGRAGVVIHHCGAEPLPELAAENECMTQHLYCIRFEAAELWGASNATRDAVYLELWEDYLEPAP